MEKIIKLVKYQINNFIIYQIMLRFFFLAHVELLAIRIGLQLATRAGCNMIQVESDSSEAVAAYIIKELVSELQECSILYILQKCNEVTNNLAKSKLYSSDFIV